MTHCIIWFMGTEVSYFFFFQESFNQQAFFPQPSLLEQTTGANLLDQTISGGLKLLLFLGFFVCEKRRFLVDRVGTPGLFDYLREFTDDGQHQKHQEEAENKLTVEYLQQCIFFDYVVLAISTETSGCRMQYSVSQKSVSVLVVESVTAFLI